MLDLRTDRPERTLEIGRQYLSMQTDGWQWNGVHRWWNVFTTATGYNGAGGYWIIREWMWNNSHQVMRTEVASLSSDQSRELEAEVARLKKEARR